MPNNKELPFMTYIRQCTSEELEKLRKDMWWAYHEILHMRSHLLLKTCTCNVSSLDAHEHDNECEYRIRTVYP